MSRETAIPLALVVLVLIALGAASRWLDTQHEAEAETQHQARVHEREEAAARQREEVRTESRGLLANVVPGVELGADVAALIAARPADAVRESTSRVDPGFTLYEEALPNGAQVMYAFEARSGRLARVQALSQLESVESIAPHLTMMRESFGPPTGVWDCRDPSGIATRRFTWRGTNVGLADILLVYGGRISLTLYVTTNEQMVSSLERARCTTVTPEQLEQFPTTSPAQIRRAAREEESHP
jgi:hypothetical protein